MKRHNYHRRAHLPGMRTVVGSLVASIALLSLLCSLCAANGQTAIGAVAQEFPYQHFPENLPRNDVAQYFPQSWKTYGSVSGRNAVFSLPASAPDSLKDGVEWSFAGAGAIPLNGPPLDGDFKTTAYTIGIPVGVSVVQGIVYAGG